MTKALLLLIAALVVAVIAFAFIKGAEEVLPQMENGGAVACTMDAMECPDGSYVGRSGPNCEFAPCPGN